VTRSTPAAGLHSGELARRAGVSADTLRVYERRGLLAAPRRAANGYRIYPAESLERVLLIQRALAFGFTLPELTRFLDSRAAGRAPCHDVREAAARRLREIDSAIADLRDLKKSLADLISAWDAALSGRPNAGRHHFLEALPSRDRRGAATLAARRFSKRHARTKETP
jgi:DNA-binding transcriptional MerR regulator